MLSIIDRNGVQQHFNNKSWNLDRFLQIERNGSKFYFRTSPDGKKWENLPNSPVNIHIEKNKKIKVGLFQATHTESRGYVTFDNFKCWQPIKQ